MDVSAISYFDEINLKRDRILIKKKNTVLTTKYYKEYYNKLGIVYFCI